MILKIDRSAADAVYRSNFGAFFYRAFDELNPGQPLIPGWHIDAICYRLQRLVMRLEPPRLILNLAPRSLKSTIVSVALPAWQLGRDPACRIICASYSEDLAAKFSRDCRALIESPFFRRLFPLTRLDPKKAAEREFETTRRGGRLATSVGGTVTGRGGQMLIIDDPLKADDAAHEAARRAAINWLRGTALSRLDDRTRDIVILAMQRLHVDDPSGQQLERGWPNLVIPLVAEEPADYPVGEDEVYHRPVGEALQPDRDRPEDIAALKADVGSYVFAAQYQQNPVPPEGNMVKAAWLGRYLETPTRDQLQRVVISCDPSGKSGIHNDFSAMTVIGLSKGQLFVLEVKRGHWTVLQMHAQIVALSQAWGADLIIVEDTASGPALLQTFAEQSKFNVIARSPKDDKVARMYRQLGRFEAGKILLPTEAPWLANFETELLAFPHGRYDDQVDALLLFLDWFASNGVDTMTFATPIAIPLRNPFREVFPDYGYTAF